MEETLNELEELYAGFSKSLAKSRQEKGKMQEYFGGILRGGMRADGFSDKFAEDVKLCIERFAETSPQSREALTVMRFVLNRGHNTGSSVISMQEAVQGLLLPLTPMLDASDAQALLDEYYSDKRVVRRLLPAQRKLMKAIKERSMK